MYDGKAVQIKSVHHENEGFLLSLRHPHKGIPLSCYMKDEKLNAINFNIGYSNQNGSAGWFYRRPLKQYRQGLRGDQMLKLISNPEHTHHVVWDYHSSVMQMLENKYPALQACEENLKIGEAEIMAFHKDFAVNYDRIHEDMIVEYRGKKIGRFETMKRFKLLDEYKYLNESLTEVMSSVYR